MLKCAHGNYIQNAKRKVKKVADYRNLPEVEVGRRRESVCEDVTISQS